jgi:hypothetical protein
MTTLIEFLNARLDEDAAVASAATAGPWEHWTHRAHTGALQLTHGVAVSGDVSGSIVKIATLVPADAAHIARQHPARALAEVEAKRQIIAAYDQRVREANLDPGGPWGYHSTGIGLAIRYLASSYSGHPDYLQEWAP